MSRVRFSGRNSAAPTRLSNSQRFRPLKRTLRSRPKAYRPVNFLVMRHRPFPLLLIIILLAALPTLADPTFTSGIDRANFDTSVKPGDDFYEYVNGTWVKNNPVPPEYSRWGAFPKLRDDNLIALKQIVEGLTTQAATLDPNQSKIRDFYATAMDEAKLEELGATPLKPDLEKIE